MGVCCGKERNDNFCPACGKPQDGRMALMQLLGHVAVLLKRAESQVQGCERVLETAIASAPRDEVDHYRSNVLGPCIKRRDKYKAWQEALIRAIDGE